jgi:hypothetical protein
LGDVAWFEPWIFADGDDKEARPGVVVRVPLQPSDLVTVVERTTTRLDLRGLDHPADPSLRLNKPGRFVLRFTRSVTSELFCPPNVEIVGRLPDEYLHPLIKMWEEW